MANNSQHEMTNGADFKSLSMLLIMVAVSRGQRGGVNNDRAAGCSCAYQGRIIGNALNARAYRPTALSGPNRPTVRWARIEIKFLVIRNKYF